VTILSFMVHMHVHGISFTNYENDMIYFVINMVTSKNTNKALVAIRFHQFPPRIDDKQKQRQKGGKK